MKMEQINNQIKEQMKEQKKAIRKSACQQSAVLEHGYCIQSDGGICRAVVGLDEYERARTVFIFVGTKREINTRPIISHGLKHGKRIAVPRCVSKGVMEAFLIQSLDDLEAGSFGIPEPKDGAPRVEPEEIDLAVIPCCTCSRTGKRLGYGGGYYDRYLARVTGTRAVICRARLMREDIPVEGHDQAMDVVISEEGIWRLQ